MADRIEGVGSQVDVISPPAKVAANLEAGFVVEMAGESAESRRERFQVIGLCVEINHRSGRTVGSVKLNVPRGVIVWKTGD
jgi:hypothetical protein